MKEDENKEKINPKKVSVFSKSSIELVRDFQEK